MGKPNPRQQIKCMYNYWIHNFPEKNFVFNWDIKNVQTPKVSISFNWTRFSRIYGWMVRDGFKDCSAHSKSLSSGFLKSFVAKQGRSDNVFCCCWFVWEHRLSMISSRLSPKISTHYMQFFMQSYGTVLNTRDVLFICLNYLYTIKFRQKIQVQALTWRSSEK